ncbi:hypothetical protein [Streptomyces sp. NPDC049555]|uniref:hypothetical protein n=1 Tax=Streptomyces sp. NPDC049555 TaxID=3154930 RepID=UPI0034127724
MRYRARRIFLVAPLTAAVVTLAPAAAVRADSPPPAAAPAQPGVPSPAAVPLSPGTVVHAALPAFVAGLGSGSVLAVTGWAIRRLSARRARN